MLWERAGWPALSGRLSLAARATRITRRRLWADLSTAVSFADRAGARRTLDASASRENSR